MGDAFLEPGSILLIVHRRLYDGDQPRYFVGTVRAFDAGFLKIEGYSWVRDPMSGTIVRKDGRRTKLVSLASAALFFYELSADTRLESIHFESDGQGRVQLSDGSELNLDLTEGISHGRR
ncbi:MAG: hypothetical protein RL885_21430 [Planctomycetota bacterium]